MYSENLEKDTPKRPLTYDFDQKIAFKNAIYLFGFQNVTERDGFKTKFHYNKD